jgi:membrane protease YdiL (CAAX protease family)
MISPALAIVALCWVLAHSTTKEFLWVGVVLALASVLFALVRRRAA